MGFLRGRTGWLVIGCVALLPVHSTANAPSALLQDSLDTLCPTPLAADAAVPPMARVALLWRQPSMAEQMAGRRGLHPSQGRASSSDAAQAQRDPRAALDLLNWSGSAELLAGRPDTARRELQACMAQAAASADLEAEAACTNNLGVLEAASGRYAAAQALFETARARYRQALARLPAPAAPTGEGLQGAMQMMQMMQSMGAAMERLGPALGVVRAASNLGEVAVATGQGAQAERHFREAQAAATGLPATCAAGPTADLVRFYLRAGRGEDARAVQAAAAGAGHDADPRRRRGEARPAAAEAMSYDIGRVPLNVVSASQPAVLPGAAAQTAPAPTVVAGAFALGDEPMSLGSQRTLRGWLEQAVRDEAQDRVAEASEGFARVALRAMAVGLIETELTARAGLMRLSARAGHPGAAIAQGKRAVGLIQQLHRSEGAETLDRTARRALLKQREQVHAQLVALLLQRGRLAEAEQVLQMLKQDEGLQFQQRLVSSRVVMPDSPAERALWARAQQSATALLRTESARRELADRERVVTALLSLTPAGLERARLRAADDVLDTLGTGPGGRLEQELARLPVEAGPYLAALLANGGSRLKAALQKLAEDAPAFAVPRLGPQALARTQEAARRAGEFVTAFSPMAARLLQGPGGAGPRSGSARTGGATLGGLARVASDDFQGALLAVEFTEALWRLERERQNVEAAYTQAEARQAGLLEQPVQPAPDEDSVGTLAQSAPEAALLHYLPAEGHTDVLLITARARQTVRLPIGRAALDALTLRFLGALRQPSADPRPAAQALHAALIAPVQARLEAEQIQVLVLSLHDRLRFVPFAALHDGQGWLTERYAVVVQPGARLAELLKPSSPRWQIAAFGASAGGAGLPPLPAVRTEVQAVTGEAGARRRGRAWLDRAFTSEALRQALGGEHQVLHIASHFHFQPGNTERSFLLLGDGSPLSLQTLVRDDYRFDRLELVTLSACETGLSESDPFGQEVDGLAALLMARGARSVMASLWRVADQSTGDLMSQVYRLREEPAGARPLPLALALQRAQLALIRGKPAGAGGADASRGASPVQGGPRAPALLGTTHPYHWASFVIMGAWR